MRKTLTCLTAAAALPAPLLADPNTPSVDPDSAYMKAGAASYGLVCFGCHQPNGQGIPGAFPPLAASEWIADDPTRAIKIVLNGLRGPLEIGGSAYNLEMPPQGPLLDDLKLAQTLTYVRNTWGNAATAVTADQVKALRDEFGDRVEYWNTEELLALHPLTGEPGELSDGDHPLKDMQFATYDGSWNKLPDFTTLKPKTTGKLPGNRPDVAVRKSDRERFGIRFSGTIEIPVDGEFEFALASDDGSRLSIDGKVVIDHDGVHGMNAKNGKAKLAEGTYPFLLDYFEASGGEELELSWSGPGFKDKPLSKNGAKRNRANKSGIPLGPDGMVARIYRNFIQDAGPRAIGVGYPGAINLAWDAANMRPALLWRGPFIDAARHWQGRGQGFQPPANPNYLKLHDGTPFAVLDSPNDAWPTGDDRTSDKLRTGAYVFRGYKLDKNNWPTFRYTYGDIAVTDHYQPVNPTEIPLDQTATDTIARTVTLDGKFPVIYNRAAIGTIEQLSPTSFQVDDTHRIDIKNAGSQSLKAILRPADGDRQELVIAASPGTPIITHITLLK
ncbi:MAG: PA14 domain-containing protein [Verrucomicrobiales bacterium]|nr:PA14 domain-containing protein [Verrucomicrobiales bacterium]